MKYLKMLGLAAVAAAALMAITGASTASATVICHTTSTPCPEKWPAGTEPRYTVKPGGAGLWKSTTGTVLAECPEGELRGEITNAGSAAETVKTSVPASGLTWKSCINAVTLEGGTIEIHANAGTDNGTVTVSGFKITINSIFGSCVYGFPTGGTLGTLTGSGIGSGTLDINTVFLKQSGGGLCTADMVWTEEFVQERPSGTPLYVVSG